MKERLVQFLTVANSFVVAECHKQLISFLSYQNETLLISNLTTFCNYYLEFYCLCE